MPALRFVLAQPLLLRAERWCWFWLHRCSKARKHTRVDLIGLSQDPGRTRILAHSIRLDHAGRDVGVLQAFD